MRDTQNWFSFQIYKDAKDCLSNISQKLGDKNYFFGDQYAVIFFLFENDMGPDYTYVLIQCFFEEINWSLVF